MQTFLLALNIICFTGACLQGASSVVFWQPALMFLEIKSKHHLVFAHHLFMAIIVFLLSSPRDEEGRKSPLFGEIFHGTNTSATSDNEQVNSSSFSHPMYPSG